MAETSTPAPVRGIEVPQVVSVNWITLGHTLSQLSSEEQADFFAGFTLGIHELPVRGGAQLLAIAERIAHEGVKWPEDGYTEVREMLDDLSAFVKTEAGTE